jgi:hypothetical protein
MLTRKDNRRIGAQVRRVAGLAMDLPASVSDLQKICPSKHNNGAAD